MTGVQTCALPIFGSGGSTTVNGAVLGTTSMTTSWARYTATITLPSISGKTIGTSSYLQIYFAPVSALANGYTLDIWGVQLEAGSTATPFTTATGTKQGELAACQRYYWRQTGTSYSNVGAGYANSTTIARIPVYVPSTLRTNPTSIGVSGLQVYYSSGTQNITSASLLDANTKIPWVEFTVASGLTAGNSVQVANNGSSSKIGRAHV